ncbi:11353_t:CDS:2 [Ambispora leptoticha]|uniref:11353_t:CDS:1 n=1 Tax=Ambispora leptoticha TaxID=144679 RepID=A0A9N9GEA1_9GLOM|nr:11353_t:CDS:2 [Ambispora leptoticha]
MYFDKSYAHIFTTLLLLIALTIRIDASPAPGPPDGGTVWNSGDQVTIAWTENKVSPLISDMSGINVQLMTGGDLSQVPLADIATGLSTNTTSVSWTVPSLSSLGYPAGKIYFIMFSDSAKAGSGVSWSTRFTILDGKTPVVTYNPSASFTITKSGGSSPTDGTTTVIVTATPNDTTTTTSTSTSSISIVTITTGLDTPTQSSAFTVQTGIPIQQNSSVQIQPNMHVINIALTLLLLFASGWG